MRRNAPGTQALQRLLGIVIAGVASLTTYAAHADITQLQLFNHMNGYQVLPGMVQRSDGKICGSTGVSLFCVDPSTEEFQTVAELHGALQGPVPGTDDALYGSRQIQTEIPQPNTPTAPHGAIYRWAGGQLEWPYVLPTNVSPEGWESGTEEPSRPFAASDGSLYFVTNREFMKAGSSAVSSHGFGQFFRRASDGTVTMLFDLAAQAASTAKLGTYPTATPILLNDGSVFASTTRGMPNESATRGTIFAISPTGTARLIASYTDDAPQMSSLDAAHFVQGDDSLVYGTIKLPELLGTGAVFAVNPRTNVFKIVHAFTSNEGKSVDDILFGRDGLLYGVTRRGGANDTGTVFRIKPGGDCTFELLYSRTAPGGWGSQENSLIQGTDGHLYVGSMTLDRFTLPVQAATTSCRMVTAPVKSEPGPPDEPDASVRNDAGGLLDAGGSDAGCIASVTIERAYDTSTEGSNSRGAVVRMSDGDLYATTLKKGIVHITPQGMLETLALLGNDTASGGDVAIQGLVLGHDSKLYGVVEQGAAGEAGYLFRVSLEGVVEVLHTFPVGVSPQRPVHAPDGTVYGTTAGTTEPDGSIGPGATLYKVAPDGSHRVLFEFDAASAVIEGQRPRNLLRAPDGTLYLTTSRGSARSGSSSLLRYAGGQLTVVATVNDKLDGLALGTDGKAYLTHSGGGTRGALIAIRPDGQIETLHAFEPSDGYAASESGQGPMFGPDGRLYGVSFDDAAFSGGPTWPANSGTLYRVDIYGRFERLHVFAANSTPSSPYSVFHVDSSAVYGTYVVGIFRAELGSGCMTAVVPPDALLSDAGMPQADDGGTVDAGTPLAAIDAATRDASIDGANADCSSNPGIMAPSDGCALAHGDARGLFAPALLMLLLAIDRSRRRLS